MANLCVRYHKRGRSYQTPFLDNDMDKVRRILLDELRKDLPPQYKDAEGYSLEKFSELIFKHRLGFRLTLPGFIIMKNRFQAYSFEHNKTLTSGSLMALDKLSYPYYITNSRLILFSDTDAMLVNLTGSVENFLNNISKT